MQLPKPLSGQSGAQDKGSTYSQHVPLAPGAPSTWFSTWNWITSSMLAKDHTLTLPSSPHVAQWDSLGLKTTSFTCG